MRKEKIQECPDCDGRDIYKDSCKGEIVCGNCGLIIEDGLVDFGKDWGEFKTGTKGIKRASGRPTSYSNNNWTTTVGNFKDIVNLNSSTLKFQRLQKWQQRLTFAIEKNLIIALADLRRITSQLHLSKQVEEEAARIYTMSLYHNTTKGRRIETIMAASCYAAAKKFQVPRTLEEVAEICNIKKKELGRAYITLLRHLKMKIEPSDATDYIGKFCSELNLGPEVQTKAVELYDDVKRVHLVSGRSPTGLAAALIYISALKLKIRLTQRRVADVARVTEVTIRNRYKEIVETLDIKVKKRYNYRKDLKR